MSESCKYCESEISTMDTVYIESELHNSPQKIQNLMASHHNMVCYICFKKLRNIKKKIIIPRIKRPQSESLTLKLVKLQLSLKPQFNFNINFSLEKYIQGFFDKISDTISKYKILKDDEKRRIKLEKIENERKAKIVIENQKREEEALRVKLKEQSLKDEARLEKQRTKDIKLFLRKEQALLRIEQAEKQKNFLKQLRLDKQIEKFRIREVKELERLEKISLREKRED